MDFINTGDAIRWILLLILAHAAVTGVLANSRTVSRTTSYKRVTISRTTSIRSSQVVPQPNIGKTSRPCPRPPSVTGLVQFITIGENVNISDSDTTFPAWTTIDYVCQDPGRARLNGSPRRRCIMGVWDVPVPTCETVRTQFGISTSPNSPREPLEDGSLAVYLTPYTTHVDIACAVVDGAPELLVAHIPVGSPRTERYSTRGDADVVAGLRISQPESADGGRFTCRNSVRPNEFHNLNILFDDTKYSLQNPCPADMTLYSDSNSSSAEVTWVPPTLFDIISDMTLVASHHPGERFELGKTDVFYQAVDILGIVDVCVFTVSIEDNEPPVIMDCPDDIVTATDPGRAMAQVTWTEPTVWDNSGNVTTVSKTSPGTYFGIGAFTIGYTATDSSGNSETCVFSITVEDREAPVLTCPPDIEVNTSQGGSSARATWNPPTANDNSGYTLTQLDPGSGGTFVWGKTVKTFSVQDETGNMANCSFTVTVKDNEPPMLMSCPGSIQRYIETARENTTTVMWREPVANDNVGISWPWYRSHAPRSKFGVGVHTVVYLVRDLEGNNATCSFEINIVEARCSPDETVVDDFVYTWPSTITHTSADSLERCPINTDYGGHPLAIRYCQFEYPDVAVWHEPRRRTCGKSITPMELDDLRMVLVSPYNVEEMATFVEEVVTNQTTFEASDIQSLSATLQNIADVESPSPQVTTAFVEIVDKLLSSDLSDATREETADAIATIVQTLDRQITQSANSGEALNIATPTIAVRTTKVRPGDERNDLTFAQVAENGDEATGLIKTILTNDTSSLHQELDLKASIQLPSLVFEVASNGSSVPVSLIVYKDDTLFPSLSLTHRDSNNSAEAGPEVSPVDDGEPHVVRRPKETKVLGQVISASVGGLMLVNLSDPVVIEFAPKNNTNITNIKCVYWDFGLNNGRGDWSNHGCQYAGRRSDGGVVCHCNHLTNFAVLVDIYGQFEISQKEKLALDIITRIGCFLSIAGLAFTVLTFLIFKSLRSNRSRQILIHLCVALLCLYVVFVSGIAATDTKYCCIAVAALLHFFVLVTVMWMGVEARNMYILLVKVFKSERSRFLLKASIIAWGLPLIGVCFALGFSLDSYKNDAYCFLVPGHVMYYGLLLPIGVILIHNIITFSLAIRNLVCSDMSGNAVNKSKREQIISRLQNAICMSVLLGLTWSFGFLAVGEATFTFRLLFCIFNSFQGFVIFALFCMRSKEVRSAWSALSLIECNIRSQSYRVQEKSYHNNSDSAWNGPCVIDWGDAPGLDIYMQANRARFRDSATSEESRIPSYSVSTQNSKGAAW